jgi:hypothetical protein
VEACNHLFFPKIDIVLITMLYNTYNSIARNMHLYNLLLDGTMLKLAKVAT